MRSWSTSTLVVALCCALTVVTAEAGITTSGDVSPTPLGPGDTTVTSTVIVGGDEAGTLTIDDAATLTINQDQGCCMVVARPGAGTVNITRGGKLIMNDTSPLGGGGISLGGSPGAATGGPFSMLISGKDSALVINGIDTQIVVGRTQGASGTMTVQNGASIKTDVITVARDTGSSGTLNVAGDDTAINLTADAHGNLGAGFSVGGAGMGTTNVTGGARVHIDGTAGSTLSAITIGGSHNASGGTGTLTVSGSGTLIDVGGNDIALRVGFDGTGGTKPTTGTMIVASDAQVRFAANARGAVGATVGSTGNLIVTGASSVLDAGAFLGIARDRDDQPAGTGHVIVSANGTLKATDIHIGPGGTLGGNAGTIVGNVVNAGGTVALGQSPGTMTIVGGYQSVGGKLVLEVDASGNHDVLTVIGPAAFDPSTQIEIKLAPGFLPAAVRLLPVVLLKPTADAAVQVLLTIVVPPGGGAATTLGPLNGLPTVVDVGPVTPAAPMVAAVLPGSRSVAVGAAATAFVTLINAGSVAAEQVGIAPSSPIPASFSFQTTDPSTNAPTGQPNTPATIAPGGFQTFVIAVTPKAAFAPTELGFSFAGTNTVRVAPLVGINTLLLSGSSTPVPDIVALAATVSNDGIVNVPGPTGAGAFAVATVNVGASGQITAVANFGDASLPAALAICQTDPATGLCLQAPAASASAQINGGQTPTFAIFVQGTGPIAFDPATNRVFVEFRDAGGVVRGKTSVAVRTQP